MTRARVALVGITAAAAACSPTVDLRSTESPTERYAASCGRVSRVVATIPFAERVISARSRGLVASTATPDGGALVAVSGADGELHRLVSSPGPIRAFDVDDDGTLVWISRRPDGAGFDVSSWSEVAGGRTLAERRDDADHVQAAHGRVTWSERLVPPSWFGLATISGRGQLAPRLQPLPIAATRVVSRSASTVLVERADGLRTLLRYPGSSSEPVLAGPGVISAASGRYWSGPSGLGELGVTFGALAPEMAGALVWLSPDRRAIHGLGWRADPMSPSTSPAADVLLFMLPERSAPAVGPAAPDHLRGRRELRSLGVGHCCAFALDGDAVRVVRLPDPHAGCVFVRDGETGQGLEAGELL